MLQPQKNSFGLTPDRQVTVLPSTAMQGEQRVPQELTSLSGRHWFPQRWKPTLQANSQAVPLQTGEALAGIVGHIEQPVPHLR